MNREANGMNQGPKKLIYILLSLVFMGIIASAIYMRGNYADHNINITVAEDEDEFRIIAEFPKEKSAALHDYLRTQIDLSDLPNLNDVLVKHYHTPDDRMTVYLKSKPGYFKIILDKRRNSRQACQQLKYASEGIKQVFTGPERKSLSYEPIFYGRLIFLPFI